MMPMDFEWVLPCILAESICRFSHAIGVILTFPQTQQQDDLLWRKFAWSLPQSKMWFGLILVFFRPRQTLANLTRFCLNEKISSLLIKRCLWQLLLVLLQSKMWFSLIFVSFRPRQALSWLVRFWLKLGKSCLSLRLVSLSWVKEMLRIVNFVRFLEELRTT